jgi:hypothetical protein
MCSGKDKQTRPKPSIHPCGQRYDDVECPRRAPHCQRPSRRHFAFALAAPSCAFGRVTRMPPNTRIRLPHHHHHHHHHRRRRQWLSRSFLETRPKTACHTCNPPAAILCSLHPFHFHGNSTRATASLRRSAQPPIAPHLTSPFLPTKIPTHPTRAEE